MLRLTIYLIYVSAMVFFWLLVMVFKIGLLFCYACFAMSLWVIMKFREHRADRSIR